MKAERWQQVKAIFHQAVECDAAARAEFIRKSCGSDQDLLREVESLLDSDRAPGTLLENPVMGAGAMAAAIPARSVNPMIGRVIGNYLITSELARGGMGIVYRARHVTLPREVVVKCIQPLAFSEEARNVLRSRFRREAHIQSQLDHPCIVRVYEFFTDAEEYFLVMEYVPGSSLKSILSRQRFLPGEQAVALAVQALDGLAHAHALNYVDESGNTGVGIIHRDIKPANLLVDEHGKLKLTDFGIAKVIGESHLTKPGFSPGTVEYMSPEQIRNLAVDARSDLYSLGVTLYELLAGRVPFPVTSFNSDYDILRAHTETEPPLIQTLNPEVPSSLAEVVARSLKKDPDQRWQTAAEFREALLSYPGRPTPTAAKHGAARHWLLRSGSLVLALLIAAALVAAIWLGRAGKSVQPALDQPSIAVLPFLDISAEKNQEYFSDGLSEELLNGLAKTPGLRVAGRMSSFQFKGKVGNLPAIGKKLHVEAILQGSVRKQGNRVRVLVQLIKAADGFYLWSETYDREMNDIFAVQEEIAQAVTEALKVRLLRKTAPFAKSTNAEAYNAYLQGRYFLVRRNPENLKKAVGYFEQATKLEPGYAPAWVGLGESRTGQATADYVPKEEGYRKAREAVARALELDANSGQAHAAMGRIIMFHDFDWVGADASYRRALELEPGNATVIQSAGTLARALGRLDESIALYRRAIEIDPLSSSSYNSAGIALYYAGLQEDAAVALKKALELAPERRVSHCMLSQVFLAQSRPQEALAEAEKEPDTQFLLCARVLAYHALGRKKESDANLQELIAKLQSDAPYQIAQVFAFRGEKDRAFEWLERAYKERDSALTEVKGDPLLRNLEGDPRYAAWLKKLRLPPL